MSSEAHAFRPFSPRPVRFLEVIRLGDWRLKCYAIRLPDATFDLARFLILHQGFGVDYAVLGWWDRENELPIRVFVRDDDGWRPSRGAESMCVWDIEVIWNERRSYVDTILSTGAAEDVDAYLAMHA